ncbi:CPBP family intramembrane glutamic endopeptidase [Tepidibacter hydrothermalis]|uniref:CPBP family intramembrane metalloprotease n=1 Tax=Tepidibacter hydrothermalis TaxID=3036126 RepID=A0ABY8EDI4_9FIRM|nr:CPBP family intramembrane glutamic endopeptidase [Tepidibacter hydrothermalis]WFD10982.1 CPBP family intramembrane metalloprotease [Tepidibacter hydrothermalis]
MGKLDIDKIKIREIGILGAIWIFILHIFSDFLMIPVYIVEKIFLYITKSMFALDTASISFFIESTGSLIIKFIMVKWLLKMYSTKEEVEERKNINISKSYYGYTIIIILLFRIIFDNSLGFFVDQIPINEGIEEAFNELFKYPIIAIISVCIVAPIYEEIIYRGIILKGLSKKYNDKVAIIVSALLFAIMHMNLQQGINAFLLGIVMGYLYTKTKSLYVSIFAHFINNGIGIIVSSILTESIKLSHNAVLVQSIVTVAGVILMYKIIMWFRKNEIILDEEYLFESSKS